MTFIDIILHALGWLLIAAGAVGIVWSLFLDRARGRKRCPNCWYDMRGVENLTCPECGRVIKKEKKLFQTRRHWWQFALAILLIILGCADFFWIRVREVGWVKATPTFVYIALLPELDALTTLPELERRVHRFELTDQQYSSLVNRCIGIIEESDDVDELLNALTMLTTVEQSRHGANRWRHTSPISDSQYDEIAPALLPLIENDDRNVRLMSTSLLGSLVSRRSDVIPAVLSQLSDDDPAIRDAAAFAFGFVSRRDSKIDDRVALMLYQDLIDHTATSRTRQIEYFRSLRECHNTPECQRAQLIEGTRLSDPLVQAMCIWALGRGWRDDQEVRKILISSARGNVWDTRQTAISALSQLPLDDLIEQVFREEFKRFDSFAIGSVGRFGKAGNVFHEEIRREIVMGDAWNCATAVEAWVATGGDPNEALEMIADRLQKINSKDSEVEYIIDAIGSLEVESEDALLIVEPFLVDDNPSIRTAAAYAYAMQGGDTDRATCILVEVRNEELANNQYYGAIGRLLQLAERGRVSALAVTEMLKSQTTSEWTLAIHILKESGALGASAIPDMRKLADSNPAFAANVEDAVRNIEWAVEHEADPE